MLAAGAIAVTVAIVERRGDPSLNGLFNDFYDYWAAGRLLGQGGNPYDPRAVSEVLGAGGVHSTVGTAYSYPLLLAELVRPLASLPPGPAAAIFTVGSLVALWLGVALLLSVLRRAPRVELFGLATAAALFAPVLGTLYFGQVNLYLLPLVVLGWRALRPAVAFSVAAAVKLYPAAAVLAFVTLGRRGLRPLLLTVGAAGALIILPNALARIWPPGGAALGMLAPDAYWSNESINGWVSRLPVVGLPKTAVMLVICAVLGALVLAVALVRRDRPWAAVFALLLGYGVVAAPKNSLWNFVPLLVVIVQWWSASGRSGRSVLPLAAVWTLVTVQGVVDAATSLRAGYPEVGGPLASIGLYGGLLLLGMAAHQLLTAPPAEPDSVAARVRTGGHQSGDRAVGGH